jgi:hypothetical protein
VALQINQLIPQVYLVALQNTNNINTVYKSLN